MSPLWTFLFGLIILGFFAWYFFTEIPLRKRLVGAALTLLMLAFCLDSVYPPQEKVRLGLDLQGGSSFLIRLVKEEGHVVSPDTQSQAVEVIRKRVDRFGVSEPVITPHGGDRILVQIAGLQGPQIAEARDQLQRVAKLEFKMVHPQSDSLVPQISAGAAFVPPGYRIETYQEERGTKKIEEPLLIKQKADLGGERVTSAHAFFDQSGYGVALNFDGQGGELFGKLTAANVGNRFAIVLDGEIQSAPVIRDAIYGGQAVITGRFTELEARNLASVLENPLAVPVKIEEERNVSASLGSDSIRSGVYAGVIGLGAIFVATLIYYKFAGIVALVGLVVNVVLLFGLMAMFNFTLTLPGIAGIILTIGMAIDANVLIYERLREEQAAGKALGPAIQGAYDKAFSAIFDSNITTLITSAILFWKATGTVRGFAVTLTVGIAASMFSSLLVTRNVFAWAVETRWIKRINMLHLIRDPNFNFMGIRKLALGFSGLLIAACIAVVALKGPKNLGVDFRGGDLLTLEFAQPISQAEVRAQLQNIGQADATIQMARTLDTEVLTIRSPFDTGDRIAEHLKTSLADKGFEVIGLERVGPMVGRELAISSLVAIALGMLGILLYVSLRYEFSFAVGAIIALLHDCVITVGAMSFLGREYSLILVGAVLTIAGYSINDTIIIFDRIRETIRAGGRGSIEEIMNRSINATLSRTLLTSGLTLLSVVSLLLFGGPVLRDFSLAMVIGMVAGSYSTIFIAAPLVLWWSKLKGKSLQHEIREAAEAGV